MAEQFRTRIEKGATKDTAGIVVPPEVVEALGRGKRPPVTVTIAGYSYRSTVASMGGRFMIGLSREHRNASGLQGGEMVDVSLELDTEPRVAAVPADLGEALRQHGLQDAFDRLAPSRRKEFVRQVEEAKTQATRERRIAKVVTALS